MTRVTRRRSSCEAGSVAGDTGDRRMLSRQGELRRAVIERRRFPGGRRVALCAIMIEVSGHVIGVLDGSEFVLMAAVTVGRCSSKSRRMATDTSDGDVGAG